jgi:hypothetical protein
MPHQGTSLALISKGTVLNIPNKNSKSEDVGITRRTDLGLFNANITKIAEKLSF